MIFKAQTETVLAKPDTWTRRLFDAVGKALRNVTVRRRERTLRISETLALSDKRFLAIVECDKRRLLIGVTSHSITLLEEWNASSVQTEASDFRLENSFFDGVH